jgi:hypothetical protein
VVGKTGLTHGAHASVVDREKALTTEGVNQRRKNTSAITPTARVGRAAWVDLWVSACGTGEASGANWVKGRVGRKVGRAESEEKDFVN